MATTTIDNETKLSAVNSILGAIGQSPISSLTFENPEVAFIFNLLRDSNVDVQSEGWHFNTENHVEFTPVNDEITIADNILKLDVSDDWSSREYDVINKNGKLYDKLDHTQTWTEAIDLDVVYLYEFENIPVVFRRYITYRASRMAATQLVANPDLVKILAQQEALARAACMEYECNQGNHSMFGFPDDSSISTYKPWRNLRR
tara:strand:- start:45 stop:653 length:609 start_codon:yes stop_codon:yes gene_type:complete